MSRNRRDWEQHLWLFNLLILKNYKAIVFWKKFMHYHFNYFTKNKSNLFIFFFYFSYFSLFILVIVSTSIYNLSVFLQIFLDYPIFWNINPIDKNFLLYLHIFSENRKPFNSSLLLTFNFLFFLIYNTHFPIIFLVPIKELLIQEYFLMTESLKIQDFWILTPFQIKLTDK